MKKFTILAGTLLIPFLLNAQFEQKMSFSFSAGTFKTVGQKTYRPEWATSPEEHELYQMPNYRPGICLNGMVQLNVSRHFSIGLDVGYLHSGSWFYDTGENVNCLHYSLEDTITDELLAEGENELNLTNISIGLIPSYYLYPWKKLSLFVFAGLNINFTSAKYRNNEWKANDEFGMLDPDDTGPCDPYLEKNTGLGMVSGIGAKYDVNDKIGFYLSGKYHYGFLKKENFKTPGQAENFQAIFLQAGIRMSFLKSKKL